MITIPDHTIYTPAPSTESKDEDKPWEIKDHRKSLGSKLRIYLGHSRATFSCCVKSSIEQEKAACFWTDLYLSTPNWPSAPTGAMHSHLQLFIFGCQPISSQHAKGLWSFSFFCPMWKGAIPLLTFLCLLGGGQTTDWQHGGQMLSTCRDGRIGRKCFRSQMWKHT